MTAGTPRVTEHRVVPLDALPEGEGREFAVAGRRLAVFRLRGGGVAVTDAACPHRGGPLADGMVGAGAVVCPLHNMRFALDTGECDTAGARAVAVHPARVDDDGCVVVALPAR